MELLSKNFGLALHQWNYKYIGTSARFSYNEN